MKLVNSIGETVEFNIQKSKYVGGTSEIYEVDDSTLLKIHNLFYGESLSPINHDNFDLLKSIKHRNFINLIERYHRVPATSKNVEAYTYEHIKGELCNILHLNTDFVIDEFNNIYNLFGIFNSENMRVSDVDATNSLVLKDRIVIIDPDFFQKYNGNKETLIELNRLLFINLMESYFKYYDKRNCNKLFDRIEEEKDPVKTLEMRLKGYKTPYDYFNNN